MIRLDLSDMQWERVAPLSAADKTVFGGGAVDGAGWRDLARPPRDVRQLELSLPALPTMRIATRYDKTDQSFKAMINLDVTVMALK